jgi:hypothetical protein
MKTRFSKYWGWYAGAAVLLLLLIFKNKLFGSTASTPPADGSPCQEANGKKGLYKNGVCDTSAVTAGTSPTGRMSATNRVIKCYPKAQGTRTCVNRIVDKSVPSLYGSLYSQTDKTCCYIF